MPGTFHCYGIGNSGEREGAGRRRTLASRVSVLGRMEYIQRTVTFVERYHSGDCFAVNVGVSPDSRFFFIILFYEK